MTILTLRRFSLSKATLLMISAALSGTMVLHLMKSPVLRAEWYESFYLPGVVATVIVALAAATSGWRPDMTWGVILAGPAYGLYLVAWAGSWLAGWATIVESATLGVVIQIIVLVAVPCAVGAVAARRRTRASLGDASP